MRFLLVLCLFTGISSTLVSAAKKVNPADKILIIKIDEAGFITDGRDTISSDEMALYISERLFKNYTGTGKMYDKIQLQRSSGNVPPPVIEVVLKEITAGQKAALAEMCLHKYKKLFDTLSQKQQEKLKKQFPVLFQSGFEY